MSHTVFAPTDKAFNKAQIDHCTTEEILLYHIIPESLPSCKLGDKELYPTLKDGEKIRINKYHHPHFNNTVTVNGAPIKEYDGKGPKGIVHHIDEVLFPPTKSIWNIICSISELSIFRDLIWNI